jgi:transcriptional regulator with PAS, ATPase and Fis domain
VEALKLCLRRALSYNAAVSETTFLRKQLRKKYDFKQIVGNAPKMQDVFKLVERVANTDSTILILGESGTGKELVARALHFNSRRQNAPFIPINCSAMPEQLLESELFGHCRGAFTGAINDKKGLFQEANGGTIFLDEIGSMPLLLQSRLLRVLQEREIRRVGDNTPVSVNVRVLAASNELLEKKIKDGTFREDLYYRLNVIPIPLPPLRERRDDIPLLVSHFLRSKTNSDNGCSFKITREALEVLCAHDWPGNVRELENAIERAVTLCETETVHASDLPPSLIQKLNSAIPSEGSQETAFLPKPPESSNSQPPAQPSAHPAATNGGDALKPLKNHLHDQELVYIQRALELSGGDKEIAAQQLGVSLATLYRKLGTQDHQN